MVAFATAALSVLGERRGHRIERIVGRRAALEPEPDQIHTDEPGGLDAGIVDRPDALVADRHAVLVDAVLEAPEPRGVRADERVRAGVGNPEVLRVESGPAESRLVGQHHLRFVGRAVGVLGEDH